ncbi:MAG TPA: methyltransferase domain-containing protein [Acidimicrobiales bacterium]|jgi:SAM-dependent methyltransferase
MSEQTETFQIPLEAAEMYEAAFVPAFFAQWAPTLCEAAGVASGRKVLDVATGTGIVARTAADRGATVTGVDLNEAMLTVARRARPELDWRQGNAQRLPFGDREFDVVVSQMALMFFPDPAAALAEMARVVVPGGTVAVMVPGALDRQAAFAPFVAMAARHAGPEAVDLLTAYFRAGDLDELAGLMGAAGPAVTEQRRVDGTYRAPSVDAFVTTEVESTPLVERMSAETYQQIREEARTVLAPFTAGDGSVAAPFEANLVVAVA